MKTHLLFFATLALFVTGCSDQVVFRDISSQKAFSDNPILDPDDPDFVDPGMPTDPESPIEYINEVEIFEQKPISSKLDILIVVDNSDSMYMDHYKNKLAKKFQGFIATLAGVDYQIGVVTTDMRTQTNRSGWNGRIDFLGNTNYKILDSTFNNAENLLLETIHRPEAMDCRHLRGDRPCGTNTEEPLRTIMKAIERRNTDNYGLFRNGSDKAVIVVSDENEMGSGPAEATKAADVLQLVKSVWDTSANFKVYGIVIKPGDKDCYQEQRWQEPFTAGANYGTHVAELAQATGGKTISICKDNYTNDLASVGQNVRSGELATEHTLKFTPLTDTLGLVFKNTNFIPWSFDDQRIVFAEAPPVGAIIEIHYSRAK